MEAPQLTRDERDAMRELRKQDTPPPHILVRFAVWLTLPRIDSNLARGAWLTAGSMITILATHAASAPWAQSLIGR